MNIFEKLSGLYLVVSPILPTEKLLSAAARRLLMEEWTCCSFLQEKKSADMMLMASALACLAKKHEIPFLINNSLELAKKVKADGVHFDACDVTPTESMQALGSRCIVGYTVNIDLEKINWAEQAGADYVSFCSIFHQCSGNLCPIVSLDTVRNVTSAHKAFSFCCRRNKS